MVEVTETWKVTCNRCNDPPDRVDEFGSLKEAETLAKMHYEHHGHYPNISRATPEEESMEAAEREEENRRVTEDPS